jgi:ATP:ADP antiporter, AAA family
LEIVISSLVAKRRQVRRATVAGTGAAAIMIAAQVGGKATRDALFLDAFSAAQLPQAMLASAVLSAVAVLATASAMSRWGPRRIVPGAFVLNGSLFALEYAFIDDSPELFAAGLYLHVAVLGALLISGFWSLVSERFDPHTAKKVVARMNAGATSGGLVGGLVADRVASWFDARAMLLVLALMSFACALAITQISRGSQRRTVERVSVGEGLRHLSETPYLKLLAALVALAALSTGLIDFAFKAQADATFQSRESLMSFFALFYTATGLVTFLAQAMLSKIMLSKLGLGGTVATLPTAVVVGGTVAVAVPSLIPVVVVRGADAVLVNSLYRSGYELLFTPLAAEKKRATKTVIDVGFDRLGDVVASGVVLLVLAALPSQAIRLSTAAAIFAALLVLWIAFRLHHGYVAELAESLKSGRLKLGDSDVIDATTRRTLADTTMAIDREVLLRQIDELRTHQISSAEPSDSRGGPTTTDPPSPVTSLEPEPELVATLDCLASGEPSRIRQALRPPIDPRVVGLIIPLLGNDVLGRAVRRALRQSAPRVVGQLVDALLDEAQPAAVRRRLADILGAVATDRAAYGLFAGLGADEPDIRERCAQALGALVQRAPELAPPAAAVFAAVEREVSRGEVSLPRVFDLLSLALEAEPLRLALNAIRSDDEALRGTSFEYLDYVLPENIRAALSPHLHQEPRSSRPTRSSRSQEELLEDLKRSTEQRERESGRGEN